MRILAPLSVRVENRVRQPFGTYLLIINMECSPTPTHLPPPPPPTHHPPPPHPPTTHHHPTHPPPTTTPPTHHPPPPPPSLGFKPTLLRLSESAIQDLTHCTTRGLRQQGRVSPGAYHTITPFWVVSVHLVPQSLPALTPTIIYLDPRSMPVLTLIPLPMLGPPWPSIMVCLGPQFGPTLTCYIGLSTHPGTGVDGASGRGWKLADFLLKHV